MAHGVGKRLSVQERIQAVRQYRDGLSSAEIGRRFGVSDVAIRKTLQRAGVDRRGASASHRTYTLNEAAFDEVTPESAYWAGFLLADGAICDTEKASAPRIELGLQIRDRGHVEAFKAFLGAGHPVVDRPHEKSCRLAVRSKRLADALQKFGVLPRKSFTAEVPKHLEHNVDFWRGVVDGDGSIKDYGRCPRLSLVGSRGVLDSFKRFCLKLDPAEPVSIVRMSSIFRAQCYGNLALKIVATLYIGASVFLHRKKTAAEEVSYRYAGRKFRSLVSRRRSL